MARPRPLASILLAVLLPLALAITAPAAPKADLWPRWAASDQASAHKIDHTPWSAFLAKYLNASSADGINRLRYTEVTGADRDALTAYLAVLQNIKISGYPCAEQEAYWINLYNAQTVKLVLDAYPVKTIKDIPKALFFSLGPWDKKYLEIEGESLTLNDVEHRILRPIWKDPRHHYALNCASLGCPNLQPTAFTPDNMQTLLSTAARDYVNHPRGARLEGGRLILSSIYDWYGDDFGGTLEGVIAHLRRHAAPEKAKALEGFGGKVEYEYDWRLNE